MKRAEEGEGGGGGPGSGGEGGEGVGGREPQVVAVGGAVEPTRPTLHDSLLPLPFLVRCE